MKRVLVYSDSNSWGYLADSDCSRFEDNWPRVMARHMGGIELIEENLPGRTTVHDDAEHIGEVNNGLRFLEGALRSHAPLDAVIILLGTNDLKARFEPSAARIADNIGRLIAEIRRVGGGSPVWDDPTPPKVFVICPPVLSERANDPTWERVAEWRGAKEASEGLAHALSQICSEMDVPFFDSSHFVEGGQDDPIHWTDPSHLRLGQAVAHWLSTQGF